MTPPSSSLANTPGTECIAGAAEHRSPGTMDVFERWLPLWHATGVGVPIGTTVIALAFGWLAAADIPLALAICGILIGAYWMTFVHQPFRQVPLAAAIAYAIVLDVSLLLLLQMTPAYALLQFAMFPQLFFLLPGLWAVLGAGGIALALSLAELMRDEWALGAALPAMSIDVAEVVLLVALSLWIRAIVLQSSDRQHLIEELEQTRLELAAAERQSVILEERGRLAREIHDTLAQGFASVVAHLETADASLDRNTERARHHVREAEAAARASLGEARGLAWALRPDTLAAGGLPAALERIAAAVTAASHGELTADLTVTGSARALHTDVEVTLLRAAQESLANVGRHATAHSVTVTLSYFADQVTLDVADDGSGFDQAARTESGPTGGMGLIGMRERAEALGGSLTVESAIGYGTTIAVSLPAIPPVAETPVEIAR
jgi:signal transduction histidine kinase